MVDHRKYQQLTSDAMLAAFTLKAVLPPTGIGVCYPDTLLPRMGTDMKIKRVHAALQQLEETGWIRREQNVVWLIKGLKREPTLTPNNPKHRDHVQRLVMGVPKGELVREFKSYYAEWFVAAPPVSDGASADVGDDSHARGNGMVVEKVSTPSRNVPVNATATANAFADVTAGRSTTEPPCEREEGLSTISPPAEFLNSAAAVAVHQGPVGPIYQRRPLDPESTQPLSPEEVLQLSKMWREAMGGPEPTLPA